MEGVALASVMLSVRTACGFSFFADEEAEPGDCRSIPDIDAFSDIDGFRAMFL